MPAVKLTWFINGVPASSEMIRHFKPIKTGREGLEQTVLNLKFRVQQHHFKNGDMKLKVRNLILKHRSSLNPNNHLYYLISVWV